MSMLKTRMKNASLKSTPQRDELAEWMFRVHDHFTVEDVIESFRSRRKKVSPATVYRVIQMMLDLNLLIEHDFGKGSKYYEHTPGHPHHDHLICTGCNKIIEFTNEKLEALKKDIADSHGFKMENHVLQIFGICKECQDI